MRQKHLRDIRKESAMLLLESNHQCGVAEFFLPPVPRSLPHHLNVDYLPITACSDVFYSFNVTEICQSVLFLNSVLIFYTFYPVIVKGELKANIL